MSAGSAPDGRRQTAELRHLWRVMENNHRGVIMGLLATAGLSLALLVPPLLSKILIDEGLANDDYDIVAWVAGVSAVLVGITFGLRYASAYFSFIPAYSMVYALQRAMFRRLLALPLSYHRDHPLGQTISRLTNDTAATRKLLTSGLPVLTDSVISIFGSVLFMFILDRRLAFVTLVVVLPALGIMTVAYQRVVAPRYLTMRETIGGVTDAAVSTLDAVHVIQAYNQEQRHTNEFLAISQASGEAELRAVKANAIYYPATSFLSTAAMAVLVILGGVQVVRGNGEIGTVVAFFGYLQAFLAPLLNLSGMLRNYEGSMAALEKCFEVIDEPTDDRRDREHVADGPGEIRLEGIGLRVDGRDVVDGLDVTIAPGSIVAFLGDASSGRADVGRLVAGLTEPTTGSVLIDGVDARRISDVSRTALIGYVNAQGHVFAGTIRDNLRLAAPDADDETLLRHLELVCGRDMVEQRLGQGLDTPVGRSGRALPAGTRQAILIARALLRNPQVLVLDGVTDSLDMPVFEHMIRTREERLAGRTIVIATNQPIATEYADELILMENGHVAERGTPDQLRRDSAYAGLRAAWRHGLVGSR